MMRLVQFGTAVVSASIQEAMIVRKCSRLNRAWEAYLLERAEKSQVLIGGAFCWRREWETRVAMAEFKNLVSEIGACELDAVLGPDVCDVLVDILQSYADVPVALVEDCLHALCTIFRNETADASQRLIEHGILRPALHLLLLGASSPCIRAAALLIHEIVILGDEVRTRVLNESVAMRTDLPAFLASYLRDQALEDNANNLNQQENICAIVGLACSLVDDAQLDLLRQMETAVNVVIAMLDQESEGSLAPMTHDACLSCVLCFTSSMRSDVLEFEVTLRSRLYRIVCRNLDFQADRSKRQLVPWDRHLPSIGIIRNLLQAGPMVAAQLVDAGLLNMFTHLLASKNMNDAHLVLSTLRHFIVNFGDAGRNSIIQQTDLLRLIFSVERAGPCWLELVRVRLLIHLIGETNGNYALRLMTSFPLLQSMLIPFMRIGGTSDPLEYAGVVKVMRMVPLSECLSEMRRYPLKEVQERLLDPSGSTVRSILHDARFEESSVQLVLLAMALGLQDPRDEAGRRTDLFGGNYPSLEARTRIANLRNLIWAVGVAMLPSFKDDLRNRNRTWLTVDLWRLVYRSIS